MGTIILPGGPRINKVTRVVLCFEGFGVWTFKTFVEWTSVFFGMGVQKVLEWKSKNMERTSERKCLKCLK